MPPPVRHIGQLPAGGLEWDGGVLGGDGLIYGIPCNAASVLAFGTYVRVPWSQIVHSEFAASSRALVRSLLLCQTRDPLLKSLGPVLVISVLPFVVPAELMLPPDPWDDGCEGGANE